MKNGNPGEHCEGGTHQVIIVALSGNTGVGIAALKDGVIKFTLFQGMILIYLVIALVNKIGKDR